jgi:2-oxoglutarate dehydrogenase E1 component
MGEGTSFHRILYDDAQLPGADTRLVADDKIRRVVLCTGKVYYDLYEDRLRRGIDDIYLLRIEQIYPFPHRALVGELSRFKNAEMVWCQEEPQNMGAWTFVQPNVEWALNYVSAKVRRPRYAGRGPSASTATGLMSKHQRELKTLLDEALGEG